VNTSLGAAAAGTAGDGGGSPETKCGIGAASGLLIGLLAVGRRRRRA
jgi:hypothetical protein